jgi:heme-degrading monooxygenase HmoA
MISRQWKGLAKKRHADAYLEHLLKDTFPQLSKLDGFVSATVLRREVSGGVEFQVVTTWQSLDAIRAFAGADVTIAVVPGNVQDMMVEYDKVAKHYEIVASFPA